MGSGDGGGCVALVIIIAVIAWVIDLLIKLITKVAAVAINIVGIIIAAICAVGAIIGVFYAFKSFFTAVMEAMDDRKTKAKTVRWERNSLPRDPDNILGYQFFEQAAEPTYFNGGVIKDIGKILKNTFSKSVKRLGEFADNISLADGFIGKLASIIKNVFSMVSLLVFGMTVSLLLSIMIVVGALFVLVCYKLFYVIVCSAEKASFARKSIHPHCPHCKNQYDLPIYLCPRCGIPHKYLRPSRFGIFYRTCGCLERIPVTAGGKCSDGKKRSELSARCPFCGREDSNHELRQLSIPLIGGVNAGKTTFKTAFLYQFITDEATKLGLDTDINGDMQRDYDEIKNCYIGKRMVTETRPGKEYDIFSFDFTVDHKSLDVKRQIHIYDMPGEVFEQSNAQERLQHFTFSEGVIFVIDPYTLQSVFNSEDDLGGMRVGRMDFNTLVEVFCETLEKLPNMPKRGKKYSVPVAVCINKVDTPPLRNRIGMPAVQQLMNGRPDVYTDRYDTMDALCREFLTANGKSNALLLLDQNFEHIHYFSCSSTGSIPKGPVRFMPEHVLAAMYWIIARSDNQLAPLLGEDVPHDIDEKTHKRLAGFSSDYYDIVEAALVN